jgi:quercetin dioxygenase-like cupin family protein
MEGPREPGYPRPVQHPPVYKYNGWEPEPNTMEHYTWDSMEMEVLSPTISRKIISGEKAMVAQVFLAKGAVVPEHHHESEQITYILEGALQFEIEGKAIVVSKGQVLRIPSHVPHRAVALEDTLDLDIFSPIRHDWLIKDDQYLRG